MTKAVRPSEEAAATDQRVLAVLAPAGGGKGDRLAPSADTSGDELEPPKSSSGANGCENIAAGNSKSRPIRCKEGMMVMIPKVVRDLSQLFQF